MSHRSDWRAGLTILGLAFVVLLILPAPLRADPPRPPVKLIFDTDVGNDIDDAMALAMIHALQSRGECELLAVTITKDNPYAAAFVALMNTFYGRPEIPIGVIRKGVTPDDGKYVRQVATAEDHGRLRFPHKLQSGNDAPEATGLLREVLAKQADQSVVIVQVGFSTNLVRLLASGPDEHSPLDGMDLVRQKVRLLSPMAGGYTPEAVQKRFKEFNIVMDLPSSRKLFDQWPTPIVASGFEVGIAIMHPARSMQEDYRYVAHHPLREAYALYRGLNGDQPTWDLTSTLYAIRPDRDYFQLSEPGKIMVDAEGVTHFQADPRGLHRFLKVSAEQTIRVREAQAMLCSQPNKP
jgi:inosine-uridine nucleoside N-ribohydrolase